MDFVAVAEGKTLDPKCSTLVLPALSIGNVGQLAVDLLVSTTGAERVAYLDDPNLLPCVGNNAYSPLPEGDLTLPLEAYELPAEELTIIQQRSPVIMGMMIEFARNIANFAAITEMKHVIILSSLDSGRRKTINAPSDMKIHYISSSTSEIEDCCEQLGWKRLEEYQPSQRRWKQLSSMAEGNAVQVDIDEEDFVDEDYYPSLPFAALFSFCKAKGLKVTCILCYCSEGDNIPESFQLAEAACKLLRLNPGNVNSNGGDGWRIPFSWKTIYGPPPDMSLF